MIELLKAITLRQWCFAPFRLIIITPFVLIYHITYWITDASEACIDFLDWWLR